MLIEKTWISFKVYNPLPCTCEFRVAQESTIPFGRTINHHLANRAAVPIGHAPQVVAHLRSLPFVGALPCRVLIIETIGFSRSWLVAWSNLYNQITYFSLCGEPMAYLMKAKGSHAFKRKASACKLISLLYIYFYLDGVTLLHSSCKCPFVVQRGQKS